MSYILEALKKSDQERKQGHVPDLQTVHVPVSIEQHHSRWLYLVIILLLLSLAFVLGWLRPWESPELVVSPPAEPVTVSVETLVDEPVAELPGVPVQPVVAEEAIQDSSHLSRVQPVEETMAAADQPQVPAIARDEAPSLELQSVPHLYSLPELVQQSIPKMIFAGHVYSSNIAQRSIIINDHSMSEGDRVMEGLEVEQITPSGVVFNYQGQLFKMDVLQDWSFD